MTKQKIHLLLLICALGCNTSSNEKASIQADTSHIIKDDTVSKNDDDDNWLNDLVVDYIKHNNNELIQLHLHDSANEESWMDEGMSERDGSTYYMCQIGHDVAEEDGSEPRFVTDGWVYVDSAKRILYEYDVANDSLIVWKR